MASPVLRAVRITAVFAVTFSVLFLRFATGFTAENEATRAAPWGLLPLALLFGLGAWGMEMASSSTVPRRDALWALCAALGSFAILRLAGVI